MLTRVMTIGTKVAQDEIELVAVEEPGIEPERIATSAMTQIADGAVVRDQIVLVDVDDRDTKRVALFVRGFEPPHRVDVERFETVLAAFRRAGVADLVSGPSDAALRTALEKLLAPPARAAVWDPRTFLTSAFLDRAIERDETFPTMWWDDDPSAGVDEMAGLLKLHGVSKTFPRKRLVADAVRALDRTDDEEAARDALCVQLCEVANALLAKSKLDRRFCGPFFCNFNGGEPNWLFTTKQQYEALISEKLLIDWDARLRAPMTPTIHERPPDRGEIDFSKFPSGDDPF